MRFLAVIACMWSFLCGQAQTTFPWVDTYNTSKLTSMNNVFMLKTGDMLFTGCHIDPKPLADVPYMKSTPRLYRTTAGGALISSKVFVKLNDTYVQFISNVFENGDSLTLIGDGLHDPDSVPTIVFAKCSYDLNVGTVKTFPIPLDSSEQHSYVASRMVGGSRWKRHPEGGYYGVMDINGYRKTNDWSRWTPYYILCCRLDLDGTVRHYAKENLQYFHNRASNLEYSPTLKQYVTTAIDGETHWVDSTFAPIRFDTSTWDYFINGAMEFTGTNTIMPYKGNHVLVGGYYWWFQFPDLSGTNYTSVHTVLLDDSFKVINRYNLRPPCVNCTDSMKRINNERSRITAEFQSFDYRTEDSIFFVCAESALVAQPTYSVFMADSNFTVQWGSTQRIENFAFLQSVKATPDGGCVVVGNTRSNGIVSMFIQKFEKTGFASGLRFFNEEMNELVIYPNPGNDRIFVSGTMDQSLTLRDTQGRLVRKANAEDLTAGLNVEDLTPGLYIFTAADRSGNKRSGRWVKQ